MWVPPQHFQLPWSAEGQVVGCAGGRLRRCVGSKGLTLGTLPAPNAFCALRSQVVPKGGRETQGTGQVVEGHYRTQLCFVPVNLRLLGP